MIFADAEMVDHRTDYLIVRWLISFELLLLTCLVKLSNMFEGLDNGSGHFKGKNSVAILFYAHCMGSNFFNFKGHPMHITLMNCIFFFFI